MESGQKKKEKGQDTKMSKDKLVEKEKKKRGNFSFYRKMEEEEKKRGGESVEGVERGKRGF